MYLQSENTDQLTERAVDSPSTATRISTLTHPSLDGPRALGAKASGISLVVPTEQMQTQPRSVHNASRLSRARVLRTSRSFVSVAILIGLWQLAVTVLHPNSLAIVGPWQVVLEAKLLWQQGALGADLRVSGEEFGLGFAIASVLGVSLGVLLGVHRRLAAFFDPWVTIFYTVPVIAIAPMIIIGLGITLKAKVVIVLAATVFPVLLNTQAGIRNLDGGLSEVAAAFRASKLETLRYVLLPGSVPYILTGIRLGVGRGLIALVAGDLFGATQGIGYLILSGEQNLNTAGVYVGVVILSILGLALTQIAKMAERHFATYRVEEGGGK